MKLIQQCKLFFREGKSDKVYEIDFCELSANEYLVNFRYGRRGGALKEGTKTATALSFDKAKVLFTELENEKRRKGYQTEIEVFIELPSLDAIDMRSEKGAILQRLQDAIDGKNSFKTEWKTSRVIWRAGHLGIQEAIPFIIKLTAKADEMQIYASLWALTQLKASQAVLIFQAYAFNIKQKDHIRNIALEGFLAISNVEDEAKIEIYLLEQLPAEIRYAIETNDNSLLNNCLTKNTKEANVDFFSTLYILCKMRAWLLPVLTDHLKICVFRPPYFKQIRAIYKLAQLRNDYAIIGVLSYRFEKEPAMFKRTVSLGDKSHKFVSAINEVVNVGAELRNKEGRLAFSHFTKNYLQKNSISYLRELGKERGAKNYLQLAVAVLLQYSEADYSASGERPLSRYGQYDYQSRLGAFQNFVFWFSV